LDEELTADFGRGYTKRNLELIHNFYLTYKVAKSSIPQIIYQPSTSILTQQPFSTPYSPGLGFAFGVG
jgi:hypothetical protein